MLPYNLTTQSQNNIHFDVSHKKIIETHYTDTLFTELHNTVSQLASLTQTQK